MGGSVKKIFKAGPLAKAFGLDVVEQQERAEKAQREAGRELKTTPAGTPTVDDARQAAEQADLLRRRRGRAATVLTGSSGDTSTVNVGTKTLLGG